MSASSADKFMYTGSPGTATTLSSPGYTTGVSTSITVGTTASFPTTTGCIFAIDTAEVVTTNGVAEEVQVAGTYCVFSGAVTNGTTISSLNLLYGTAQSYTAGALTRVYIPVSSLHTERMVGGLLVSLDQDGTLKAGAVDVAGVIASGIITNTQMSTEVKPVTLLDETTFDFIASGLVWSGDAYASTRNASMTDGVLYINGQRLTLSAVTARSFTASKDTYIDVLNTAGVASLVYTEAVNNAASPGLAANSVRIGIIVTGATNIAAVGSVNQGQETMVLPIVASVAYAVTDSLGNLICPRDPNRKILGYRQIIADTSALANLGDSKLTVPVIVPTGRKVKINVRAKYILGSLSNSGYGFTIWDGAISSTQVNQSNITAHANNAQISTPTDAVYTPSAGSHTYTTSVLATSGTGTVGASAVAPAFILVELA